MFKLIIANEAEKSFAKFSKDTQKKVIKKLDAIADNPYIGKKLSGDMQGCYSLRAWPYRIIYKIWQKQLIVTVLNIAYRQGVYK